MGTGPTHEVTQLLMAWSEGDQTALGRLMPVVHDELRRWARHYLARERAGHTLQTTAPVNEAYIRLIDAVDVPWQGRAHLFGIAARWNLLSGTPIPFGKSRRSSCTGSSATGRLSLPTRREGSRSC